MEYDRILRDVQDGRFEPRVRNVAFSLEDFNADPDGTNARLMEDLHAD